MSPGIPKTDRSWMIVIAVLFCAAATMAVLMVSLMERPTAMQRARPPHKVAAALPGVRPPAVEPMLLTSLSPDQARASNAAVPFVKGALVAARPFVYGGTVEDQESALTCLSTAILYEAGDDKPGEQAVAQVVLNRLRHPAFPKTICGVVFQGSDRKTGCQFTFTCDGSLARTPNPEAWERARVIASTAMAGFVFKKVGTATHYHTDWVVPYWRAGLDKVAEIHTQIFYRWPGWWGLPAAFSGRPQPLEQMDPRILALARPVLGAAPLGPEPGGTVAETDNTPPPPRQSLTVKGVNLKGNILRLMDDDAAQFVLQLDPAAYPGSYAIVAYGLCRNRLNCLVMGWLSTQQLPRSLPVMPVTMHSVAFLYRKSDVLGVTRAYWNCTTMPRGNSAECLPGTERVEEARTPAISR